MFYMLHMFFRTIESLYKVFEPDFKLFGYSVDKYRNIAR